MFETPAKSFSAYNFKERLCAPNVDIKGQFFAINANSCIKKNQKENWKLMLSSDNALLLTDMVHPLAFWRLFKLQDLSRILKTGQYQMVWNREYITFRLCRLLGVIKPYIMKFSNCSTLTCIRNALF